MLNLRVKNFRFFSRCLCQIEIVLLLFLYQESTSFGKAEPVMMAWGMLCLVSYPQFLLVAQGRLNLTPKLLKALSYLLHLLALVGVMSTAIAVDAFQFSVMQHFLTAFQFSLMVVFLEPRISIPFQVLCTIAEVLIYLFLFDKSSEGRCFQLGFYCSCFQMLLVMIASSLFIDLALRRGILALLEAANSESLVDSFRRLIRGLCDGTVLLDSQMNVAQESEGLQHLIRGDTNFNGKSFKELLADEDQNRFRDFVETSMASQSAKLKDSAPLCSRVGFRGSEGIQVAADLYHVPVPELFGAEAYHLIAFKEDVESRALPEAAEDAVPQELSWKTRRPARAPHPASVVSEGPDQIGLQEMTLLLDVDSELQDVQQAHLKFRQREEGSQGSSPLLAAMPSLSKLVKESEWEKIRSSVQRFVDKALRDPNIPPKELRKMTVQLAGQSGWFSVDEAFLHHIRGANHKVWLQLTGFHPESRAFATPDPEPGRVGIRQRPHLA